MTRPLAFAKSPAYQEAYPEVPFGLTLIAGCRNPLNPPGFDQHKRKLLRRMRRRETLARITARIATYEAFFRAVGHPCPLPEHLKRTVHSGFPRYNLMVDAHFMAEMCAGVLVAVTDHDAFEGGLTLDLARNGETCLGLGGRHFVTREGEVVLRDEREIVCVLCQGADEKTRVTEQTVNALFYAYGVPGIEARHLERGLTVAAETLRDFGGGQITRLEIC